MRNENYQQGLRAALDLDEAMDYINRDTGFVALESKACASDFPLTEQMGDVNNGNHDIGPHPDAECGPAPRDPSYCK
jgi:hypothetical protein